TGRKGSGDHFTRRLKMRNLFRAIALAVALAFAAPAAFAKDKPADASARKADKLDLNTASEDELKALPGTRPRRRAMAPRDRSSCCCCGSTTPRRFCSSAPR